MTTTATAGGLARDTDLFGDQFPADPLPTLAQLHVAGRAVFLAQYDLRAVVRHHLVHAVLRVHERFSSSAGAGLANLLARSLLSAPQQRLSNSLRGLAALAVRAGPIP